MRLFVLLSFISGLQAQAMVSQVSLLKPRAFFLEGDNKLFEPLDLKRKTMTFGKVDFDDCKRKMVRQKDTLHYTCTIDLPLRAKISKRHNQITPVILTIQNAGSERRVIVQVASDAGQVTYSTEFDATGFDLDVAKFNDDFYRVYGQTALNVISEAMKATLQIEVLESRDKKVAN
jgi:hypothetical protein